MNTKRKNITDLRNSLFETFEDVSSGNVYSISHKNGSEVVMISVDELSKLRKEVELHKNLSIGYAQALRGEGISSEELKRKLREEL